MPLLMRWKFFRKKFFVGLLLSGLTMSAHGAVVYLKDGGQLSGTIISSTAKSVRLQTSIGIVRISNRKISHIDYEANTVPPPPAAPAPAPAAAPAPRSVAPQPSLEYENLDNRRQLFSIDLGFSAPLSRVDFSSIGGGTGKNGSTGILLGAQYVDDLTHRGGTGFDFEYFNRSASGSPSLLPTANTDVSGDSVLLMPIARYTLVDHGAARPYLLAGLGLNWTSMTIDSTPNPGFVWADTQTDETRRLVDDSSWGWATTLRLGIDFHFMDPAIFSLEMGWTGLSNGRFNATPDGQNIGLGSVTGSLSALDIVGRWGWRF